MKKVILLVLFIFILPGISLSQTQSSLHGQWTLLPHLSHDIGLYANLSLNISQVGNKTMLIHKWGTSRSFNDSLLLSTDGTTTTLKISDRVWPANVFMGLSMPVGGTRQFKADWERSGKVLQVQETYTIRGSQGNSPITTRHTYELSGDNETLTYTVARSSRTTGPPVKYVLKRAGTKEAFMMRLENDWEIEGKLPTQAFLISLQGLANADEPKFYFIYPPGWDFTYTEDVYSFFKNKRYFTFRELKTAQAALQTFKSSVKGYVVWDKSVRTSLTVAFTVAGLERAVVVSEEMIPMMEKTGLKPVADFRGKFTGQTDAQIYTWAYNQYWSRCNKEYIIWLGGERGTMMKPGVADWGVAKGAFFNDLSCRRTDTLEYKLASKILSEMKPASMIMGWHSYAKDLEREYVTLTSNFGHRVEGLHTLPNISFSSKIPVSTGFKFKNNHQVIPGKIYKPEKKVYVTCVQTDGIGLGAWLEPGRGEMPCAWEVLMNYVWMAPSMAEYFYTVATPNDYFIGCLSGPGYMYPKAVPPKLLPGLIAQAKEYMDVLDLNVFETMDYSEGATVEGNTDLPKDIIDAYYRGMPNSIGFINGYAPSHTFTIQNGKPFLSFDYYLSPERPEADAVADLKELASINKIRPYFLLVHVREYSNVARMKAIMDKLGPEFEVVPLDVFLKLAGQVPTYKERFLEKK